MRVGFNMIRVQLTVPTRYMMEAADEIGLMLIPEMPVSNDYQVWHDEHMPRSCREMVRWCRNHPCIARYSLGNEIRTIGAEPWHRLIDVAAEEAPTRPLLFDGGNVKGRPAPSPVEGEKHRNLGEPELGWSWPERVWTRVEGDQGGHAYKSWHYAPWPVRPAAEVTAEKPLIVMMGEFAWRPDGMPHLAIAGRKMRLYDYAYLCTWTWLNYWPNFLEGMSAENHGLKTRRGPARIDHVNGWHSPIVDFVHKSLHPYLLLDVELEEANPFELYKTDYERGSRKVAEGTINWPAVVPTYQPESPVTRRIEVFNGGLSGRTMSLQWEARWDRPDGPLVARGHSGPFEVRPGFHTTKVIRFRSPATTGRRALYLVMRSLQDDKVVFLEDQVYFWVEP
jgi:hypothetical protein